MTRAGLVASAVAATLVVASLTITIPAYSTAGTITDASQVTPPPPTVGGRTYKWGLSLSADRKAQLERERRNTGEIPEHNPLRPRQGRSTNDKQRIPAQEIRLHVNICGHAGGNTPALIRCLPAIEDDRPEQPELPSATPSMALAIRIPRPEDVTWAQVLSEVKNVAFPGLGVKVQPVGRTLVNQATIVYTDQSRVSVTTVTLLGFPVVVEATPLSYTWSFGDGTSVTTTTPGRPYPAMDITHKYMKKAAVRLTLTTNYGARFNVAGTGWQYVDGVVPITGPTTTLQVREAVPVLVEPEN
ncbi:PKD domain-containing protein [Kribbella sp. CA-293567]|uniref:PKD domain-containing protein n=1 Tax=Kribbella sp. CA-293567 TaxID=3002436 RepID=UPI0022DE6C8C|nr:PKD domain-containing protein [Kribbella sp. CA-293567]WBQ04605.1 hypothetical protein OX958_32155 [Kribbella sp. CA-293567]